MYILFLSHLKFGFSLVVFSNSFDQVSTNMEGESKILAGEILVATSLVEEALLPDLHDSARHRAFKHAVFQDWQAHRIPLNEAVQNDLFLCV